MVNSLCLSRCALVVFFFHHSSAAYHGENKSVHTSFNSLLPWRAPSQEVLRLTSVPPPTSAPGRGVSQASVTQARVYCIFHCVGVSFCDNSPYLCLVTRPRPGCVVHHELHCVCVFTYVYFDLFTNSKTSVDVATDRHARHLCLRFFSLFLLFFLLAFLFIFMFSFFLLAQKKQKIKKHQKTSEQISKTNQQINPKNKKIEKKQVKKRKKTKRKTGRNQGEVPPETAQKHVFV